MTTQPGTLNDTSGPGRGCPRGSRPGEEPARTTRIVTPNGYWPIYTHPGQLAPARFIGAGIASESVVSPGCIVRGQVTRSVLSPGVTVGEGAVVQGSVLHDNVRIGRGAVVRGSILDKNVDVPPGATIGVNPERDQELYTVSKNGVIALGKGRQVL